MKRRNFAHRPGCAVEATLDLIDGKWKGVILFHLQAGTQRFGELRRRMPGITQRMLTKQLRALEDDKLVIRKVYAEVPPRVEYTLSDIGESLRPVIETLRAWGEGHQERLSCAPAPDAVKRPIARRNCRYCAALSSLVAASHLYVWRQIPGFSHEFDPLLRPAAGLRSRCNACAGAGPARAVLGRRAAAVLRADRAARAAGGGERLCRQDRAEPQPAAGRPALPPLLRRPRPAARADAALARIGRDGRSVGARRHQQPRHRGRRSGQDFARRQARVRGRDRAQGQPHRSGRAAREGRKGEIRDARLCQFR